MESLNMRVLSPRMEPPVRLLEGSTAITATLCALSVSSMPRLGGHEEGGH